MSIDTVNFRPQGWVSLDRIVDGFGKEISYEKAIQYGWLKPVGPVELDASGKEIPSPNLFLDQGRQILAYALGFRSPVENYTIQKFGVGTGITPARVTDVALEAPVTLSSGAATKAIDAIDFTAPFVMRIAFTLGLADANGYILSEMGLFSGGGALIARKIRAVSISKTSDFSPTLSWKLRLAVPFLACLAGLIT